MFGAISKSLRELDRRIRVLYLFIGIHTWQQALPRQYNELYATALGASPVELGSMNSLGTIGSSMLSLPSGWIADRYGVKTMLLIELAFTATVSAIYGIAISWWILIPAYVLSWESQRVNPYTDILLINYAKPQQRASVLSLARVLWTIPTAFASMVAAAVVTSSGGINATGIRPLYYVQLVLSVFVLISIALWLKAPSDASDERHTMSARKGGNLVGDLRDVFKDERWLKRWIVVKIVRSIGTRLVVPFVPLWIVRVKGADPYILGVMWLVGMAISVVLQIPAARLADRIGRKKAFLLFCPFTYLGSLLLVMAPSPQYLILVGVLGGIGVFGAGESLQSLGGGSFVPFITMEQEMVPPEKRGRWHGLLGFFNIFLFPIPILGGIMWQSGLMVEVLLLPILLDVLITIPVLSTIPDTLGRSRR